MRDNNQGISSLYDIYKELTCSGGFHFDESQATLLSELEIFASKIQKRETSNDLRFLQKIFKKRSRVEYIKGFYIHGSVGTGKTMLMDLLFENINIKAKKRVHFHEFMKEIHSEITKARKKKVEDPLELVAFEVFQGVTLICFDEMQISDIADAMLVGRLFEKIVSKKISFICTSNRPPDDLYKDGLNRELFLPFIKILKNNLRISELSSNKDYRRDLLKSSSKYFISSNRESHEKFNLIWRAMTKIGTISSFDIKVGTRNFIVPCFINGIARMSFKDLCAEPLSNLDYLSIFNEIKVLFLENIPIFNEENRDSCKRFINLIDIIYENQVSFICKAEAFPGDLHQAKRKIFEFERTISRLEEMRSEDWPRVSNIR